MVRVHKDLFDTGGQDKIHADEIVVGNSGNYDLIGNKIGNLDGRFIGKYVGGGGTEKLTLKGSSLYLLVTGVGSSQSSAIGVYVINSFSSVYSVLYTINNGMTTVTLDGYDLTVQRSGSFTYSLLKLL